MTKQTEQEIFNRVQALTGIELIAEKEVWSIAKVVEELTANYGKELSTIQDDELVKLINKKLGRD